MSNPAAPSPFDLFDRAIADLSAAQRRVDTRALTVVLVLEGAIERGLVLDKHTAAALEEYREADRALDAARVLLDAARREMGTHLGFLASGA